MLCVLRCLRAFQPPGAGSKCSTSWLRVLPNHSSDHNAKIVAEEAAVEAENEIVLQEVDPAEGTNELPSGEAGVVLATLQDKCGHLRQWAQFVDRLLDIGFVPIKVPADGNCLAWSFKCLVESDYQGMGLDQTHPQHLEDVAALRKKLGEAWKTNSTSPAWKQNEGMQRNRGCMQMLPACHGSWGTQSNHQFHIGLVG